MIGDKIFPAMALGFFTLSIPLNAATLKKVLLLDFKNVLKKKEFNYLEDSITDAVRNKLKGKFVFKETERESWKEVAEENFISEEDLYTYTAAMNLGLLAKQDVVIFGGYIAEDKKDGGQDLLTRVRILDIGKKKEIANFELKNPIDSTIFNTVDKIADRIVKEAAAVLPSKEEWARGGFKEEISKLNQLSLRGQFAPITLAANRSVVNSGQYAGSDFKNVFGIGLDFYHFGIFKEQLGIFGAGIVRTANNEFQFSLDNSPVAASLQTFAFQAGVAWRQKLYPKFYLQPFVGGGVQYELLKFNYESKTVDVTNSSGQVVSSRDYSVLAPFASTGLRMGYIFNSWLFGEVGAQYTYHFFKGSNGQSLFAELGVGFRL